MPELVWRKSSRSNGMGANCVEVALGGKAILIRDSKQVAVHGHVALQTDQRGWEAVLKALMTEPA